MSGWGQALRNWLPGQYSPFAHPGQQLPAPKVSDDDFSYFTPSKDIANNHQSSESSRSHREADIILLKHQRTSYPARFPAYAVDDGRLEVADIRAEASRVLDHVDPRRVHLFYKGRDLLDNRALCRDVGMTSKSSNEILCTVSDRLIPGLYQDQESESEEDEVEGGAATTASTSKKRRNRKRRNNKKTASDGPDGSATSQQNVEYLPTSGSAHPSQRNAGQPSKTSSNQTPSVPLTPMAKLLQLSQKLREDLGPQAQAFMDNPPADKAKKDFEHKKFTETILAQVLLKLDAVETEGNEEARTLRKALVKEAQGWLNRLDQVMQK